MSKAPPYMKLWVQDFLGAVAFWEAEEVGAYLLLLLYQWEDGSIPSDWKKCATIARVSPKALKRPLSKFVPMSSDKTRLVNVKLQGVFDDTAISSRSKKRKATRAANVRWGNAQDASSIAPSNAPSNASSIAPSNASFIASDTSELQRTTKAHDAHAPSPQDSGNGAEKSPPKEFMRWYEVYPLKKDRKRAIKVWEKLGSSRPSTDELIAAVERQKLSDQWARDKIIPMASTWLNNARWEDELSGSPPSRPAPTGSAFEWNTPEEKSDD